MEKKSFSRTPRRVCRKRARKCHHGPQVSHPDAPLLDPPAFVKCKRSRELDDILYLPAVQFERGEFANDDVCACTTRRTREAALPDARARAYVKGVVTQRAL